MNTGKNYSNSVNYSSNQKIIIALEKIFLLQFPSTGHPVFLDGFPYNDLESELYRQNSLYLVEKALSRDFRESENVWKSEGPALS